MIDKSCETNFCVLPLMDFLSLKRYEEKMLQKCFVDCFSFRKKLTNSFIQSL